MDFGPVGAFAARNLVALRVVVGVLALVVFLAMDQPAAGTVMWIAALALLALAVLEVVGRAGEHHESVAEDGSDGGDAAASDGAASDQATPSGVTS